MTQHNGIQVWVPTFEHPKGGIQAYSRFFLQALASANAAAPIEAFVKHERLLELQALSKTDNRLRDVTWHGSGSWPKSIRTLGFVSQLLAANGIRRPRLNIALLLNFAPAAMLIERLFDVPYWLVAHGFEAWDITTPRLRRAVEGASKILAVSTVTRERLLRTCDINPSRVELLPNTFDENRFQIRPKPKELLQFFKLEENALILLTVSRLDSKQRYKGHERVFEALSRLRDKFPQLQYVIVGGGDDRSRLEGVCGEMGVSDRVIFAGEVSEEQLPAYYNLCDLFVMPSTHEGFGIVYLEALGSGKPVIAGNTDGAQYALCEGRLGQLVDPADTVMLANAIERVLNPGHPEFLAVTSDKLRDQAIAEFGFFKFLERLRSILQEER